MCSDCQSLPGYKVSSSLLLPHILAMTSHLWHLHYPQVPEEVSWRHPSSLLRQALTLLLHQLAAPTTTAAASTSATPLFSASLGAANEQLKLPGSMVTITPLSQHSAGEARHHCSGGSPALASQRVKSEHQPLIFSVITPNTSPARLSLSLALGK